MKHESLYKFKFAIATVAFLGVLVYFVPFKTFKSNSNLLTISNEIIEVCSKEKSRQACYDKKIPLIMDDGVSMEDSFEVVKLIQNKDNGYWFCHAVAHSLSKKEYFKDVTKWRDIMTRVPLGICSNGGLHGALQAHFSSEALNGVQIEEVMPQLQTICEKRVNWQPTQQQQSSCYHELGHLSMYLTGGNVVNAGKICDVVSWRNDGRNYLQTCNEGIFMQVFEPREPDDFGLIYNLIPEKEKLSACEKYTDGLEKGGCWKGGWTNSYKNFCNQFSGDLRLACFREAWVIESEWMDTAEEVVDYCSYSEDMTEKTKCYNKLFYGLMSSDNFDTKRVKSICLALPREIKEQCFANMASRLIETDKRLISESVAICEEAETLGVSSKCYIELIHYASFVFIHGSEDFTKLCSALPEIWKNDCFKTNN